GPIHRALPRSNRAHGRAVSENPFRRRGSRTRHRALSPGVSLPCLVDRGRRRATNRRRRRTIRSLRPARVEGPSGRAPRQTPWPTLLSLPTCCRSCPDKGTPVGVVRVAATVRKGGAGV